MNWKKTITLITFGIIIAVLISVILKAKIKENNGIPQASQDVCLAASKADNKDDAKEKAKKKCLERCKENYRKRIAACKFGFEKDKDTKRQQACLDSARNEYDACRATCD